jgi:presenilin enhancer 2
MSAIGCVLWTVALVAWQCVFQSYRTSWGATGDYLTFTVPTGRL